MINLLIFSGMTIIYIKKQKFFLYPSHSIQTNIWLFIEYEPITWYTIHYLMFYGCRIEVEMAFEKEMVSKKNLTGKVLSSCIRTNNKYKK